MKNFDVQGVELNVTRDQAFNFIADRHRLPEWTQAFAEVTRDGALLRTPAGEVQIKLAVASSAEAGTIDWHMTFPDGSTGSAYSRVVPCGPSRCAYSFVLLPPPLPLEQLEGALAAQSQTLAEELKRLQSVLNSDGSVGIPRR